MYCFPDFNCSAAADKLKKQLGTLTRLNYNAMMGSLFAKDVITNEQRKLIDTKIGEAKMMYLIVDIIIPSLKVNNYKKYKGFLEAMEESEDSDLNSRAKTLGMLNCRRWILFIYICTYIHIYMITTNVDVLSFINILITT